MKLLRSSFLITSIVALAACEVSVNEGGDQKNNAAKTEQTAAPAPPQQDAQRMQMRSNARRELQDLRFLVDLSDRKLRLMRGNRLMAEHDVAVGTEKWPTPTGSWQIHRVDLNPEWNPPPNEEWSDDKEAKAPGAPDNPMGRARLVYRMPNTIHGTDNLNSLGKATSHGSIRVANQVVLQLAETLLRAGGAWEGPDWFRSMTENRTKEFQVELENPVPIQVQD